MIVGSSPEARIADALQRLVAVAEEAMKPRLVMTKPEPPDPCEFGHRWQTWHTLGIRSGHTAKPFCTRCGLETHS